MRAQEFVTETINTDILNKRFRHKQVIGDYTYTASVEIFLDEPLLNIKAYNGAKEIGHAMFEIITRSPGGKRDPSADYLESGGTEVDPAYRNKGVASTMYAYAKMLGNDIIPSYNQRPDGKAMWAAWEKSGNAKHLIGTAAESTVAENFADGKVKGKSRPGRVKRAGASCDGSVTDLRQRAKNASGEKAKMYHWCANMKSGRKK
jgi:GNAT superfamily N-acetyltransferase